MLGGVDTKKLFPLKILDKAGIKKSFLTQYLMRGWHEKALFTENARQYCYKKACLTQNITWSWGLFSYYVSSLGEGGRYRKPDKSWHENQGTGGGGGGGGGGQVIKLREHVSEFHF